MRGEVDLSTVDVFAGAVAAAVEAGAVGDTQQAHLDLTDVGFIDVCGPRVLLAVAAGMRSGMRLVVHDPPRVLLHVLELRGSCVWFEPRAVSGGSGRAQPAPLAATPGDCRSRSVTTGCPTSGVQSAVGDENQLVESVVR